MAKNVPWRQGRVSHIHEASIVTMTVTQRQLCNLLYENTDKSGILELFRDGTISVTNPWFVKICQKFRVFLTIPRTFPYLSEFSVIPWKFRVLSTS